MEKYHYIDGNGQQQGPVDASKLAKYGVTRETLVWRDGMEEWTEAGEVEELAGIFRPVPPPVNRKPTSAPAYPQERLNRLTTNRGFWLALLLSIVTFGFYQWYLIYAFAKETNIACRADGKKTSGLVVFLLLSLITFGIYSIVWECMWINRCNSYLVKNGKPERLQVSTYLLTVFLLGVLTIGIMYIVVMCKRLYLQNAVNATYNELNHL